MLHMRCWVRFQCPTMSLQCCIALTFGAAVGFGSWVLTLHVLAFPFDTQALCSQRGAHLISLLPFVHCHHLQRVRANSREIYFALTASQVATQLVDGARWRGLSFSSLRRVSAREFRKWKHQCSKKRGAKRCTEERTIPPQDHDTANNNLPRLANLSFHNVCPATSLRNAPSARIRSRTCLHGLWKFGRSKSVGEKILALILLRSGTVTASILLPCRRARRS